MGPKAADEHMVGVVRSNILGFLFEGNPVYFLLSVHSQLEVGYYH